MTPRSQEILRSLPSLRHYARATTGSAQRGDRYFEVCLETVLQEPERIRPQDDVMTQLFKLFDRVVDILEPRPN